MAVLRAGGRRVAADCLAQFARDTAVQRRGRAVVAALGVDDEDEDESEDEEYENPRLAAMMNRLQAISDAAAGGLPPAEMRIEGNRIVAHVIGGGNDDEGQILGDVSGGESD